MLKKLFTFVVILGVLLGLCSCHSPELSEHAELSAQSTVSEPIESESPIESMVFSTTAEHSSFVETECTKYSESANLSDFSDDAYDTFLLTPTFLILSEVTEVFGTVPYVEYNNNQPMFCTDNLITESFEEYSELDELGRCGPAVACLSVDTMPSADEERGAIGSVRPAGWHTVKYPDLIDGLYLYNRCHLIGWQLGNENANEKNLITGTRYLNIEGMLPFENQVAEYIRKTGHHVLYRVTPKYTADNLIAEGVLIEAQSVEDDDCVFCVFCFNIQPGISIDYKTGDSFVSSESSVLATVPQNEQPEQPCESSYFCLNTNTNKIHKPDCRYVPDDVTSDSNWQISTKSYDELISDYTSCRVCFGSVE